MFGNIRQGDREFTCSDFCNHVDKQNRRFELTYKSDLRMAKEDTLRGYQETFSDFISLSKSRDHCTGPCQVDTKSDAPLSLQLWPYMKHCLHTCTDKMKPLFNLLEVKNQDRSVFFTKAESTTMLLKQLISTAPRSFSYNNIQGSDSSNAIELEDNNKDYDLNTMSKDELVAKRIQQFALDMKSEDDEESYSADESDCIVVDADINNLKSNDTSANDIAENYSNIIDESTTKKHEEIDTRNKSIMRNTIALLSSSSISDLSDLAITAMSALDNIERGSLKEDKKVKSFLGRWFEKKKLKNMEEKYKCKYDNKDKNENELFVERDRIITCNYDIKIFNEETKKKDKKIVEMKYRVLSVHTKRYNRWFMTLDKQPWNQFMKEDDLKKYRCTVRMIIDGAFEGYDDVALNSEEWPRKHICKVISGLDITNVHHEMFNY